MANKKLRVGIIGIGMFAVYNHVPQLRATGRAAVVACARRNPERLAMAQQALQIEHGYTDWRRMLEEEPLDAVVVSTPTMPMLIQRWSRWNGAYTSWWTNPWH